MNNILKRFFFMLRLTLLVMAASFVVLIILNHFFIPADSAWPLSFLIIASVVIGLLSVPVLVFLTIRLTEREEIEAVKVSEMFLSQEEIARAVDLWVYSRYHKSLKGDIEFTKKDDDIYCHVHVEE